MKPTLNAHWLRLSLIVALLALSLALLGAGGASAAGQGAPNPPPAPKNGRAAIEALGDRLPEVAAEYGMTAVQLHGLFLKDHTLHVGFTGELFYADDPFPADEVMSLADQSAPAEASMTLEELFQLHSRPGADHTIYLDFDGHVTEGTTWNSSYGVTTINSPAYDIDGDPSTFNATEQSRIQLTWQIVAEDFSPFDVNVTTQDPGQAALSYQGGGDTQWGTRVVITDDTFANCGCGGHAYIGSFDDSQDEPVFVYNTSLTGVSEASSHEVGHALLLSHDGTSTSTYYGGHGSGVTSWGPIMGAAYNRTVTQWSKGDYYGANNVGPNANYNNGPDDLAIISSLTNGNGFGYRPDDHGDSDQTATPLMVNGGAVSGSGVIEQTGDVDVFSFVTGTGQVSLSVTSEPQNPNLDVLAELYDTGWNLVAVSDPSTSTSASLSVTLAQGAYYLVVDGTGMGSPLSNPPTGYTEYGSMGQYTISGTIIDNNNDPPVFTNDPIVKADANEDVAYNGSLVGDAGDPNNDLLTFSKLSGPAWLNVAIDGALTGTPVNGDVGHNAWTVQVSDGLGGVDQATLQITVQNTNDLPAFSSDPIVKANATYDDDYSGSLSGDAADDDGDPLTFAKVSGPAWLDVAPDGALSGTPAESDLGLNSWAVQVGDGNGGLDQATLQITVDEPVLFVDYVATGEILVSGSVSGSFANTQADDGSVQAITERESGGKPANRHTLLEHKWVFNVQPGTAMNLYASAWAPASLDGDSFLLSYSTNDINYVALNTLTATSDDDSYQVFALPNDLNDTVYVRVTDTDQSKGHRDKDTVYVDHMFIRSDTQMPDPPGAPSGLSAAAAGASQIALAWSDGSDNEQGFRVERSPDGANDWTLVGQVGMDVTAFSDTGLSPDMTYYYRVYAYNAAGNSGFSSVASDTTGSTGSMHVDALSGSGDPGRRNHWDATVTITVVDGVGAPVANAAVSGSWSNGATGGATCTTNSSGECSVTKSNLKSNVANVIFTIGDVQHATNLYDPAGNASDSVVVDSPL